MANTVRVSIEGDDNLSSVLDGLQSRIRNGAFQANLMGSAVNTAFGLGQQAVGMFTSSLGQARAAQSDIVKSVGALASAIGAPYEQADQLNQEITNGLAQYAAALPGSTDEYVSLFRVVSDNVAGMNKEMNNGTFNAEQYKEQVTQLVSRFRALGEGTTFLQQSNALGDLLSGGRTIAGLDQLEYFRNNPLLTGNLKNLSAEMGKDLNEMTGAERLDVSIRALEMSLTDDTISRLSGTIDSQVASFMTVLSDPNVGIFGLLRDVDKTTEGQQTAIEAMTQATTAVIGSDGLFFSIGAALQRFGVEFGDPMVQLRSGMLWFTSKIKDLTAIFKGAQNLGDLAAPLQAGLQSLVGDFSRNFASMFATALPIVVNGISQAIVWGGQALVVALGAIDWGALASAIGLAAGQIDWGLAFKAAGTAIGAFMAGNLVMALPGMVLALFGPIGIAVAIGGLLLVAVFRAHWSDIVLGFQQTIADLKSTVSGWASGIAGFFGSIRSGLISMGSAIGSFFTGLWQGVSTAFPILPALLNLFGAISNLFGAAASFAIGWAVSGMAMLFAPVPSAIAQVFALAGRAWQTFTGSIMSGMGMVQGAIAAFTQSVVGAWSALSGAFAGAWGGVMEVATGVATAVQSAFTSLKEAFVGAWNGVMGAVTGAINGITSAINSVTSMIPGVGGGGGGAMVPNAATGHFPSGLGGVLGAAIREGRSMPSGAGLVMANSSEAILNRPQQAALTAALSGRRSGGAFAPQITVQGAPGQDVNAIASEVMRRIETEFARYEAQFLTA